VPEIVVPASSRAFSRWVRERHAANKRAIARGDRQRVDAYVIPVDLGPPDAA
jgi:hypothetical protein